MQINFGDYRKGKSVEFLNREFFISKDEFEIVNNEDLDLVDGVKVLGDVVVSDNLMRVKFDVVANFDFICSRCLVKFPYDLKIKCEDEFLLNDLDEDIVIDDDYNVDFSQYIKNCIVVNIPQKKLCCDDCLGLCQSCGINLNDGECCCQKGEFENAFSQLKEIFGDLKEGE